MAAGVVDDISHEGLRALLREEGVTFQRSKTWKASNDPRYQAKKGRSPCHGGSQTLVRASPPPTAHVTERRVWHLEWPQLGSFSERGRPRPQRWCMKWPPRDLFPFKQELPLLSIQPH